MNQATVHNVVSEISPDVSFYANQNMKSQHIILYHRSDSDHLIQIHGGISSEMKTITPFLVINKGGER